MFRKLIYVSLFVKDQDRALDYYTNVVGLEKHLDVPTPDGPRFITVGVKGQDFDLVLWPGTPGRGQEAAGMTPAQYTIETADCRKDFATLQARGVTFEPAEIIDRPWGLVARFRDPDGNVLQLREGRALGAPNAPR